MRLVIVGGGATAVTLVDALSRSGIGEPLRVTIFEPRPAVGPGRPYGADRDGALINRPADEMSVRHAEPLDFREWLRQATRGGECAGVDPEARFQPRWLFGHYLSERLAQAVAGLRGRGVRVEVDQSAVVDLVEHDDGLVAITSSGRASRCDVAVLCLGTPAPADMYHLTGLPGFVPDPYPLIEPIAPGAQVTVLGSNLSAVDLALALLRRADTGPIRLMSRNGLLPSVRCRKIPADPDAVRSFDDVVRLTPPNGLWAAARRELREHMAGQSVRLEEAATDLTPGEPAADRLRRQLEQVEDPSCWRGALLPLLDPVGELLWQRLPIPTRKFFLSHLNSRIATVLNPMPPATAATLLQAMTEGRLEVISGVSGVSPRSGSGFMVTAMGRGYPAEILLNAVRGTHYDDAEPAGRLLSRLAARGLARPHPCGGAHIDFLSNRVLGPVAGLFALGHPTAGDIYYANAGSLLGISARAEQIVRQIRTLGRRPASGSTRWQHLSATHVAASSIPG